MCNRMPPGVGSEQRDAAIAFRETNEGARTTEEVSIWQ
jgi:hypothetical protein